MFQFPGFASKPLWIQDLDTSTDPPSGNHTVSHAVTRQEVEGGFPHSEILGSKPVRGSPRLIAAYHVLHRLSAPRHPPNALMTLDRSHDRCSLRHTTRVCSRHASRRAGHAKHHQKDLTDAPERELEDALPACRATRRVPTSGRCPGHASLFTMSIIRRTLSRRGSCQGLRSSLFRISRCTPLDTLEGVVEPDGIEPTTSCLQSTRSPN